MTKFAIFPKLACTNMVNNRRFYIPYLLTGSGTIAMFYIMAYLAQHPQLPSTFGGDYMSVLMGLGLIIIGVFAAVILFYTNSFLMKRRKKELGVFSILGMEKRHLAYIQVFETIVIAVISLVFGLFLGLLFSKLATLLLFKIVKLNAPYGFYISMQAVRCTLIVFLAIYGAILIHNIIQVGKAKPIELLQGNAVGQKEPKTRVLLTLIGIISLGTAYSIAIKTKNPLDAFFLYFVAVMLVILGTYLLFMTGSIAMLKMLRRNKRYYYKTKHFISVSGMLYRMKQNAAGLASICILCTMVMVMVSVTVSLYAGTEDVIAQRYPSDIILEMDYPTEERLDELEKLFIEAADRAGIPSDAIDVRSYISLTFACIIENDGRITTELKNKGYTPNFHLVDVMDTAQYQRISGNNIELADDEVAVYSTKKLTFDSITAGEKKYKIVSSEGKMVNPGAIGSTATARYLIVGNRETFNELFDFQSKAYGDEKSELDGYVQLDLACESELKTRCFEEFRKIRTQIDPNTGELREVVGYIVDSECRDISRIEVYSLYGSFFFIGIILGMVFLMATVMIIYYKQVTEGYDDHERYAIMQKVGLSRAEVKQSIHSQIIIVFFLPLLSAGVHVIFSSFICNKMLAVLSLQNTGLFVLTTGLTFVVFAIIYAIVYMVTARTYYNIIER